MRDYYPPIVGKPIFDRRSYRTGIGFDIHKVSDNKSAGSLMLLGLEWEGYAPLIGHSDGDAAAHALADALLSASGLGDIGSVIGVDTLEAKNISGEQVLRTVCSLLADEKITVVNAAVIVMCEAPNINSRRAEAQKILSDILDAPVSVSASSYNKIGDIGNGRAIAAQASALIHFNPPAFGGRPFKR
ncbi:MAG: 2-C-methyl-D-erythritol 2,4-cyclodiphosphate synthase [Bifidobacteriaceae bacterium]|jgi:2-C-methyl-D-erythritol 2,4-cyclodiphosphate synthase|nr:2-C-methyl-D-erythritol 2,4-cyclodiphosphate synthase [Bifidobacteriaceae bacterium]